MIDKSADQVLMPLDPDEHINLTAAQGFVELGMYLDADAALDDIDPFCRHLPEVLEVRAHIYEKLEKWDLMEVVAKRLVDYDPENAVWRASWAQAVARTDSMEASRRILVTALDDGLVDAVIHFNLACCECQLGNVREAKKHLGKCFEMDPKWKFRALEVPELAEVWESNNAP